MNNQQIKEMGIQLSTESLSSFTFEMLAKANIPNMLVVDGLGTVNLQTKIENSFSIYTREYEKAIENKYIKSHKTEVGTYVMKNIYNHTIYISNPYYILYDIWDSIDIYLNIIEGNIKHSVVKPKWANIKYDENGNALKPFYSKCNNKRRKNIFMQTVKQNFKNWLIDNYPELLI